MTPVATSLLLTRDIQEDGTEIIACDSCDVWQHLSCQRLPPGGENGDFICDLCKRYKQSQEGPKGPDGQPLSPQIIKIRIGPPPTEELRGRSPPKLPSEQVTVQSDEIPVQLEGAVDQAVIPGTPK